MAAGSVSDRSFREVPALPVDLARAGGGVRGAARGMWCRSRSGGTDAGGPAPLPEWSPLSHHVHGLYCRRSGRLTIRGHLGELRVRCTGTGASLRPLTEGGLSKCVSPCNLGLVLGYPERSGIFRCKTRDQGRMSARYHYLDPEGAVRLSNGAIGSAAMRMRIFHPLTWGAGPRFASRRLPSGFRPRAGRFASADPSST
jgi:hypothetical protein